MGRKRVRIVPEDAVECFELRIALYYTIDGDAVISYGISTPDEADVSPPLHEVLGAMRFAEATITDSYS